MLRFSPFCASATDPASFPFVSLTASQPPTVSYFRISLSGSPFPWAREPQAAREKGQWNYVRVQGTVMSGLRTGNNTQHSKGTGGVFGWRSASSIPPLPRLKRDSIDLEQLQSRCHLLFRYCGMVQGTEGLPLVTQFEFLFRSFFFFYPLYYPYQDRRVVGQLT